MAFFLQNVNLEAVARIGAILCSFAFVFVHSVSILSVRKDVAVFICHFLCIIALT